ncbi:hypothetical protein TIFTF001_054382 [Ficus carica]|nr:hypothetical protein TIFTF001_054382 [Ficus carica]
MGVDVDS